MAGQLSSHLALRWRGVLTLAFLLSVAVGLSLSQVSDASSRHGLLRTGDDVSLLEESSVIQALRRKRSAAQSHDVPQSKAVSAAENSASPIHTHGAGDQKVTVALISWKRRQNFKKILTNIMQYDFVHEIIIWNNLNTTELKKSDLKVDIPSKIELRIINSEENLNNKARFEACALAKHDVCYVQDDDFASKVIPALWMSFKSNPHLLNTIETPTVSRWAHQWSYFDDNIKMHGAFTYFGVAAFMPKVLAVNFLKQLNGTDVDHKYFFCCDLLFTIWTNEIPVILTAQAPAMGSIEEKKKGSPAFSKEKSFWECRYGAQVEATRVLIDNLKNSSQQLFNSEFKSANYKARTARSVCAVDDCIVHTNLNNWDYRDKANEVFRQSMAKDRLLEVHKSLSSGETKKVTGDADALIVHDPSNAVDGDVDSWYQTLGGIKKGQYFALQFTKDLKTLGKKYIDVATVFPKFTELTLQYSTDGESWHKLDATPREALASAETIGKARVKKPKKKKKKKGGKDDDLLWGLKLWQFELKELPEAAWVRFLADKQYEEKWNIVEIKLNDGKIDPAESSGGDDKSKPAPSPTPKPKKEPEQPKPTQQQAPAAQANYGNPNGGAQ